MSNSFLSARQCEKDTKEEIIKAFSLFDADEKVVGVWRNASEPFYKLSVRILPLSLQGKISFQNLKRVAEELGEKLTDEELQVGEEWHQFRNQTFTIRIHQRK